MSERVALLTRFESHGDGTFGVLTLPDGFECYTCENPWLNNEPEISCIPAGIYSLGLRRSPVVERNSGGEFREGFEVHPVAGRTYIMIHPGNSVVDTEGCILPGREISGWHVDELEREAQTVTHSRATFRALMPRLLARDDWLLDIQWGVV